jgi:hypothetical protein
VPELRLAAMGMAELRQLAASMGLRGYSRLGRERLNASLLQRLKAQVRKGKSL